MKVLVTDYAWPDLEVEQGVLGEIGIELVEAPDGDEDTLAGLADGVSGIMTCWAQTTRKVIEAAMPELMVVSRYGVGLDNIDVEYATAHGIPVTYVPDYCMVDVAEHTLALLLSLSRKVARLAGKVKEGTWDIQSGVPLSRLTGRTLGLVGFGRIAKEVTVRAQAFALRVLACSPSLTPQRGSEYGVEVVEFDDLISTSDYISLHCPSTEDTNGLIGSEALGKMKPSACVINTSRGDVIDESALVEALDAGEIAGAALDVRIQEPPEAGDLLMQMENVINTPHAAFYSTESLIELRERTAWETRRVIEGSEPENLVNPDYRNFTK
jgi:D-3-phosphoglycerate dehydrogenase